jgi:Ca2+-binding RTX toxin-like protein
MPLIAPAGGGTLQGSAQADVLVGSGSKDVFYIAGGKDSIDGGSGTDTLVLTGTRAQYGITHQADGMFTVTSLTDANTVVTLENVERVTFDNQTITLDSTSTQWPRRRVLSPGPGTQSGGGRAGSLFEHQQPELEHRATGAELRQQPGVRQDPFHHSQHRVCHPALSKRI